MGMATKYREQGHTDKVSNSWKLLEKMGVGESECAQVNGKIRGSFES